MIELKAFFASVWAAKWVGSFAGVLLSMALVPPDGNRKALYRGVLGTVAGVIFTPQIQKFSMFEGNEWHEVLAASTFTAFVGWFILEFIARWLTKPATGEKVIAFIESALEARKK